MTPESSSTAADGPTMIHSYNVRICHWINLVACGYLLWSGIHILLDFPELYWGNTGYRGYPAAFSFEDWGLSWDEAGALGDRRWGRNYHFTFAWVFTGSTAATFQEGTARRSVCASNGSAATRTSSS